MPVLQARVPQQDRPLLHRQPNAQRRGLPQVLLREEKEVSGVLTNQWWRDLYRDLRSVLSYQLMVSRMKRGK